MKNFLKKYFGYFGLMIYAVLSVILRIPVFVILLLSIAFLLLIWDPITGRDSNSNWVTRLYDLYCGR